ncbi:MAG: hypothetical protein IJK98_05275 [Clostridia bacterium]|nr:hypothetical protein [Clostridia bacterium]
MFLQLVILRIANQAGRGYYSDARQERVYYLVQIFVILGFFAYALSEKLLRKRRSAQGVTAAVLTLLLAGAAGMLLTPSSVPLSVVLTFVTAVFLGYTCGAVYHRMALATASGLKTAFCMSVGYGVAVALQYAVQLRWTVFPLQCVLMAAAFAVLGALLLRSPEGGDAVPAAGGAVTKRNLLCCALIGVLLPLFPAFYNGYIHHLQVATGYTDYNVYSWPRLMLIPAYLFFGWIGSLRNQKVLPITVLCVSILALLNSVLTVSSGSYRLNMCLFYIVLAAEVSYYNLTFWRLAVRTKHPAFWASIGRVFDSVSVLLAAAFRLASLSTAAVLTINIAELAAVIVLMAVNGDFILSSPPVPLPAEVRLEPQLTPENVSGETALDKIRDRYGLTRAELNVLRELVLTEDKQAAIGEKLSIKVRTVQAYVTSIYRKTGVSTRAGLVQLYNENE